MAKYYIDIKANEIHDKLYVVEATSEDEAMELFNNGEARLVDSIHMETLYETVNGVDVEEK